MAETMTQEQANKVEITDAGPAAKMVSIEIPAATVSGKIRTSLETISAEAALPGFRKGKVPRWLVEKRFGPALKKEAKTELVTEALNKAVEEHKLRIVGEPSAAGLSELEIEDGKPFKFQVEVEVLPEFDLPTLEGIEVKKPIVEMSDEMINDEIGKLAVNEGSLESREQAEGGDYITGHAVMTDDKGEEFYNLKGAVVQKPAADKAGKGMILGILVEDFDKQLGSPKPGETVTIKAKGPDQHEVEKVRGAKLTITFKADRVDRIIAANTEQLVGLFGFEDEAKLREVVKSRMTQRVQGQQQSVMHQQLARHLIEGTKIDLPKRMSTVQAARTLERRRLELMYRGVDAHKIEEHMAELRTASTVAATRDLKLFFILHKIAEDMKIRVDEIEVNQRIAQMAFQRNVRPEQLRSELIQSRQMQGVYQQIRDHKTLDALLNKASVKELPAEEFNKVMTAQGQEARA